MALPTLTPEQRDAALAKARETRQARTALLAKVKSGEKTMSAVIDQGQTDPIAGKIKVTQLVRALPGYGKSKVDTLVHDAGIAEDRRVAGLGSRQREALLDALN